MPTNTAGDVGQDYTTNQVMYLGKTVTYSNNGSAVTLGVIPPGAVVLRGGVVVTTAFNAGTSNVLDIGTSSDDDGFATDLALGTIGVINTDEMATSNDTYSASAAQTITATVALSGTAATAGSGIAWVEYIIPNR
jgi:hypothetical protein